MVIGFKDNMSDILVKKKKLYKLYILSPTISY